ncbi:hypothetical protein HPB50_027480 [Hyalomma asiaticum]|uniref:Uncharacterized protein n=1 Tax=Hyalomma asiaticum TaxID=266040 RepID=A0ACB7T7D6_HYAAI|nr:hypothetical protein HPB50_027480 [Hyalomma asiaticum]
MNCFPLQLLPTAAPPHQPRDRGPPTVLPEPPAEHPADPDRGEKAVPAPEPSSPAVTRVQRELHVTTFTRHVPRHGGFTANDREATPTNRLPAYVPDDTLTHALQQCGKVRSVHFATVASRENKLNSVRVMKMEMSRPTATWPPHDRLHIANVAVPSATKPKGARKSAKGVAAGTEHASVSVDGPTSQQLVVSRLLMTTPQTASRSGNPRRRRRSTPAAKRAPSYWEGERADESHATGTAPVLATSMEDTPNDSENAGSSESETSSAQSSSNTSPAPHPSCEEQQSNPVIGHDDSRPIVSCGRYVIPEQEYGPPRTRPDVTLQLKMRKEVARASATASTSQPGHVHRHRSRSRRRSADTFDNAATRRAASAENKLRRSQANVSSSDGVAPQRAQTKKARKGSSGGRTSQPSENEMAN